MNVFMTGATGFIGGSVADYLQNAGHQIRALARCAEKADHLAARGITPVIGTLDDATLLRREARKADAVINAANSDHRGAVQALLEGLRDSNKPFIHSSGSTVIADDAAGNRLSPDIFDEDTPFKVAPEKQARLDLDNLVRNAASTGVRSIVLSNSMIYGTGVGAPTQSAQIPPLVAHARKWGVVRIVGEGVNRWSNVHIDDVAQLFGLALEQAPAGSFYFVENGEASFAEIGAAIARRLGLGPVQHWTIDEAAHEWGAGAARYAFGSNSRVRGQRARRELQWAPIHTSVEHWIEHDMPVK